MAFTRAYLYKQEDQLTSHFARAISHPARICIILKLFRDGPCTVEELMHSQYISQSSISQHLAILRKAQFVTFQEEFPYTYYSLNYNTLKKFKKQMKIFLRKI